MAVYGVKFEELRYAQDCVRNDHTSGTSKYSIPIDNPIMRKAFDAFSMDYDYYLWNCDSFARLEKVLIVTITPIP